MKHSHLILAAGLRAVSSATPALAGPSGHYGAAPDLLPQNAQAGECYARVQNSAQYAPQSEIIEIEQGYRDVEVTQAQLQSVQKSLKVKEESVRYIVRQPRYRSVTETVMTTPAYDRLTVSAPQFQTVTETLQVSGPRTMWKKGNPGRLAA